MKARIRFTLHAEEKLSRLTKVGITRDKVAATVSSPERVLEGYSGCKIAPGALTDDLIVRVVYKETEEAVLIITVYPAERRRYK